MRLFPEPGGAGKIGGIDGRAALPTPQGFRSRRPPREVAHECRAWFDAAAESVAATPDSAADAVLAKWFLSEVAWAVRGLAADVAPPEFDDAHVAARRIVRRALDLIVERTLHQAYLTGPAPSQLDLTAAAALAPMARPEGWRWARVVCKRRGGSLWPATFFGHPASAWVRQVYDHHAGVVIRAHQPAAWAP